MTETTTWSKISSWLWKSVIDDNTGRIKKDVTLYTLGGGILLLGGCCGLLYHWYGPTKHPQIPNMNAPYSWLIGHVGWLQASVERHCLQEEIREAYINTTNKYKKCVNMSLPMIGCNLITTDPEIIKYIFETDFESFEKGPLIRQLWVEVLGEGIFMSDPPKWKMHRKAASRMFSMRNLTEYMFSCAVSGSQRTIKKLKELNEISTYREHGIDIVDIAGRFTLDSFIEISFGKSLDIIESAPNSHPFCDAFDESMMICVYRYFDPLWKLKRWFNWGWEKKLKYNEKVLNNFVNDLLDIETRRQLIDESGVNKHDIISLYLSLEPTITRKELRDVALNMIIAGRDSTRVLICWVFYAIENKPDIIKKIKEEIEALNTDHITYDQASKGMRYTECVLLETLRLYPSVSYSWRSARKDVVIPKKDVLIRKGESMNVHHFMMGRDKDIWGEDVLIFNPMRWYENLLDTKSPYEFVQFHIPPRLCLGKHFALMEAKIFFFYFFKNFNFTTCIKRPISTDHNEDHKIVVPYSLGPVMQIVDGYYLRLTNVDSSSK